MLFSRVNSETYIILTSSSEKLKLKAVHCKVSYLSPMSKYPPRSFQILLREMYEILGLLSQHHGIVDSNCLHSVTGAIEQVQETGSWSCELKETQFSHPIA